jgi:hypothetical protein
MFLNTNSAQKICLTSLWDSCLCHGTFWDVSSLSSEGPTLILYRIDHVFDLDGTSQSWLKTAHIRALALLNHIQYQTFPYLFMQC